MHVNIHRVLSRYGQLASSYIHRVAWHKIINISKKNKVKNNLMDNMLYQAVIQT